jgi:hypothetical protein
MTGEEKRKAYIEMKMREKREREESRGGKEEKDLAMGDMGMVALAQEGAVEQVLNPEFERIDEDVDRAVEHLSKMCGDPRLPDVLDALALEMLQKAWRGTEKLNGMVTSSREKVRVVEAQSKLSVCVSELAKRKRKDLEGSSGSGESWDKRLGRMG